MKYFTSNLMLGFENLSLYDRDILKLTNTQINTIILTNITQTLNITDELYILGNIASNDTQVLILRNIPCKKYLLKSKSDNNLNDDYLNEIFEEVFEEKEIKISDKKFYLVDENDAKEENYNIVCSDNIYWKIKNNMINPSIDLWHFNLLSESKILKLIKKI